MDELSIIEKPPQRINNYLKYDSKPENLILKHYRYLIQLKIVFGICGINLFNPKKVTIFFVKTYCFLLQTFVISTFILYKNDSISQNVVRNSNLFGFVIFSVGSLVTKRKGLQKLFEKLQEFDYFLNISEDLKVTNSKRNVCLFIQLSLLIETILFLSHLKHQNIAEISYIWNFDIIIIYITYHLEQIFYYNLLRSIYKRLEVLKGHAKKMFNLADDITSKVMNNAELLCYKKELHITSLHQSYELLFKCSSLLNSVMSVPLLVIFITSGLNSISMMSMAVKFYQQQEKSQYALHITYCISATIKSTIMLAIPCVYASLTTAQVSSIRSIVNEALNRPMDKLSRRKLKVFLSVVKSSGFQYSLPGGPTLDVSLMMSYINQCFASLIIVVQFGKFID